MSSDTMANGDPITFTFDERDGTHTEEDARVEDGVSFAEYTPSKVPFVVKVSKGRMHGCFVLTQIGTNAVRRKIALWKQQMAFEDPSEPGKVHQGCMDLEVSKMHDMFHFRVRDVGGPNLFSRSDQYPLIFGEGIRELLPAVNAGFLADGRPYGSDFAKHLKRDERGARVLPGEENMFHPVNLGMMDVKDGKTYWFWQGHGLSEDDLGKLAPVEINTEKNAHSWPFVNLLFAYHVKLYYEPRARPIYRKLLRERPVGYDSVHDHPWASPRRTACPLVDISRKLQSYLNSKAKEPLE